MTWKKEVLSKCLDVLPDDGANSLGSEGNSQVYSLALFGKWQTATVSFIHEPTDIQKCKPDRTSKLNFSYTNKNRESVSVNVVDCDFHGMTPIYHYSLDTPKYE
jgi:hypothetical protein